MASDDLDAFRTRLELHFAEMTDLLVKKRQTYGTTNLTRFGGIGIAIRASDKIERLAHMYQEGVTEQADGDTMRDAWMDLVGYGVLGLMHHDDERMKKKIDEKDDLHLSPLQSWMEIPVG